MTSLQTPFTEDALFLQKAASEHIRTILKIIWQHSCKHYFQKISLRNSKSKGPSIISLWSWWLLNILCQAGWDRRKCSIDSVSLFFIYHSVLSFKPFNTMKCSPLSDLLRWSFCANICIWWTERAVEQEARFDQRLLDAGYVVNISSKVLNLSG